MFSFRSQTQQESNPLRDAQFKDRALEFNQMVTDLVNQLPANQILVAPITYISKSGEEPVQLRTGNPQTADVVRDTMLRLELINAINRQTFNALRMYFTHNVPMDDASAISIASCGLGDVTESRQGVKETRLRNVLAFFNGMGSVLALDRFSGPPADHPVAPRVNFLEKPGVRDIFLSAIRGGNILGNPEIIC